jgi:two-component system chemotaxis sensor kinase CheA
MKSSAREFIAESEDILEDAVDCLLRLQESSGGDVDPSLINALFRDMHTLKGIAGLYDYPDVTEVSHALENLLDDLRLGRLDMSEKVISFLLGSVDVLRSLLERLKARRGGRRRNISAHLREIEAFRETLSGKSRPLKLKGLIDKDLLKVLSEYEEHRLSSNINYGRGIYKVKAFFSIADFDVLLKNLSERIRVFGELVSTMPTSEKVPGGSIGFNLIVGSTRPSEEIGRELGVDVEELLAPGSVAGAVSGEAPVQAVEPSLKASSTTVRVDIGKLDRILNTIGDLSLAEGAIERIWSGLTEIYGHAPLLIDLYRIGQSFKRRLAELQGQVLEVRMVPVGQIFGRLGQVVRRYSRKAGKDLELKVFGEDTEIDKYLAEEAIDPLVHIVRNAIDHGIETAKRRKAAGKEKAGNIMLRAFQKGNNVVIEVEDDGSGIDTEKIKRKALEKGLLEPGQEPEDRELLDLMFVPGMSTSETVNEVSGRGVGLDIVKEKISSIGGFVEVFSKKGEGTRFVLTLPITLAIIKALIVRVGEGRFAVPLSTMSETFVVEHGSVQSVDNQKKYNLRGEMLPLANLRDFLRFAEARIDRSFAVVVGFGDRRMGLLVDELMGQHSLVIKSLGGYFEGLKGFAGAAEVGAHEVILVLDVEAVIEESFPERGAAHV